MGAEAKTSDQDKGYPMKPTTKFPPRTGKLGRTTPEIADRNIMRFGGGVISAEMAPRKPAPKAK
jgi:hypothetical protein